MRIAVIGQDIEHSAVTRVKLTAPISLLDFEIVIWIPEKFVDEVVSKGKNIKGFREFDISQSEKILTSFQRRGEVNDLLEHGRTIIITPPEDLTYVLNQVGRSGDEWHITDNLPLQNVFWKHGAGIKISASENVFKKFITMNSEQLIYSAHVSKYNMDQLKPVVYIEKTDKIVGFQVMQEKGLLLFLPRLRDKKVNESVENYTQACNIYIQSIIELVNTLNAKEESFALPPWSHTYILPNELEVQSELQDLKAQSEMIQAKISTKEMEIEALQKKKLLFVGTGKALELQVGKIFESLGFEVENGEPGRVDLILRYQNTVAVVEIKGVKKSASESDASQLEKWVSDYNIEHKVQPKAILVANTFNEIPLNERTEDAFPHQMLAYSRKRDHCLITGIQLLGLHYHVQKHPEKKEDIIQEILSTVGIFERCSDWSKFIGFETKVAA